jgi:formylglycine-generating enzyme required for sulfatase activity
VTIKPFALGKFELTVEQFAAFADETKYDTGTVCDVWQDGQWSERPDYNWRKPNFPQTGAHPAPCLSWDDAKAYLAWLSRKTGHIYRLPTEAEWEYAARAGSVSRFHFGEDDKDYCRYGNGVDETAIADVPGAKDWGALPCIDAHAYTAPVGSFAPNAFGLHDTHGNVFEWVEDCWHDDYRGAPANGSAWLTGDCSQRIQRGGAWGYPRAYLRIAVRGRQSRGYRYINAGVRVAREIGERSILNASIRSPPKERVVIDGEAAEQRHSGLTVKANVDRRRHRAVKCAHEIGQLRNSKLGCEELARVSKLLLIADP